MASADSLVLAVAEHLLRSRKRRIVAPLNRRLALAVAHRFRKQGAIVRRELAPLLLHVLREADPPVHPRPVPPGLFAAVASSMAQRWVIHGYGPVTRSAYDGGAAIAAGELGIDAPERIPGPGRVSWDVEEELDKTTETRLETAIRRIFGEEMTAPAGLTLITDVFRARVDAASTIAEYEVSTAFHLGQTDTARAISMDIGEDVEKRWDCEPTACDECLDCEAEEWVDIDFEYTTFGVDDPPGHPNCQCGLSFRRVNSDEGNAD